ncbi:hypothetical protein LZF95_22235 [Algoriphagus sp. AGSA1]|uniref:hypothetical protein n=1 Tax=Algoriphagus sp. AGSA1 TaxID=2907213 RepID=UPI001F22BB10|nr:hypothetical protein [Algoriphagus sp. AGSA1]MCE7057417.1 hypothetical protein [Algoriphagus sp. AGSA1]
MAEKKKKQGNNSFLKGIAWLLLGIIVSIFLVPLFLPERFCFASIDYATFVGGLAGPLAALVGFIYVYLTFLGQQRQLDEQRERLDKEDFIKQSENASKQFSEYLTIWIDIRSKIQYSTGSIGDQAFDDWWGNVKGAVQKGLVSIGEDVNNPVALTKSLKRHFYSKGFNGKNDQYDNFLRVIYLLFEIAEQNDFQDRVNILESFMTRAEKAILVYSATFIDQNKSAIKLFKSGFCQSLPDDYLISPDHKKMIF